MKIVIDNMDYFVIPGTNNKYYINIEGEVYGVAKDKILKNNAHANSVRISLNKKQKRIKKKDALIEALFNYIEERKI